MKNNFYLIFLFFLLALNSQANEKITLQLKWFHQFQFAGYYAAKEKGFYKDLGLDVQIKERDLRYNNVQQVINGEAQYGISDSILLLYKAKKEPVVLISPIFQHSPGVLLSLSESNISSVYDIQNKDLVFYPNDTDGFSILAMLKKFNMNDVHLIRKREKGDYVKLLNKDTDLMAAYITNEPYYFKKLGVPINIINPMNYGFDLYGDILFTSEDEAKNHPNRVRKFKEATLKGWLYALENKEEIAKLIYEKYTKRKTFDHLMYEAKAIDGLISNQTIPIGTFDNGRIKYITELFKDYGLLESNINVKEFVFEEFIKSSSIVLSQEEKEYLRKKPKLKVKVLQSFPPFSFTSNNQADGYIVDYVNLLAEYLGIEVEYVSTRPWTDFPQMLTKEQIDIIPHIALNEQRDKIVDFTSFAPLIYQSALGVEKDSLITKIEDLKGKKLSILDNSFLVTIIKEHYPSIKLYPTKTIKEAIEAVSSGKVDAVIDNLSTIEYYISNNWLSNIKTIKVRESKNIPENTPLYMGVKEGNSLLKSILEKADAQIPYKKIHNLKTKWLSKEFNNALNLTKEEFEYLKNKKDLRYCINPNKMPIEKIEKGTHKGLSSEYVNIIEDRLGINFSLIESTNLNNTLGLMASNECEVMTFVSNEKKEQNELLLTNSYQKFPLVVASRLNEPYISSVKSLNNKKIAFVKEYLDEKKLKKRFPNINFIEVSSIREGLKEVYNENVYGLIGILPSIGYEVQKGFSNKLKISSNLNINIDFSFATSKENTILNSIISKTLDSISFEKKEQLLNEWISIKYEKDIDLETIILYVGISLFIITLVLYKNRQINSINEELSKYINIIDEHVLTSTTDIRGRITYASKAFCEISGYTKDELIGKNHRIIRHEDMPKELFSDLWSTISSGQKWEGEIKNKRKDGSFYWVNAVINPIFNKRRKIIGYTSIRHDISDKKRVEEISITDELTGLYNRRYFNMILSQEINRAKRDNHAFALIIFDVDFFKQYNDNYGHQKGDYVLEKIGQELKSICKRSSDFAFRIGGEEFAIIFTPHFKENAYEFAKIVNKKIEGLEIEHRFNKASKYITVSVGVYVEVGEKIDSEENIYNFTDQCLYEAKKKGRNKYIAYKA